MPNFGVRSGLRRVAQLQRALVLFLAAFTPPLVCSAAVQDKASAPPQDTKVGPHQLSHELDGLLRSGWALLGKSQAAAAREPLRKAVELARKEESIWGEAEAHRLLGLAALNSADYVYARSELEQALTLFESEHSADRVAYTHQHLGAAASYMGKNQESVELYHKALAEFEELHDLLDQAAILEDLALSESLPSNEREGYKERGLALSRQIGNKPLIGKFLHMMGDGLFMKGDYAGAVEKLNESAAALKEGGDRGSLSTVWTSLGRVYRAHGAYEAAIVAYKKGLAIQEELGDKLGVIQSLNAIAISQGLDGQETEARQTYERTLSLARETGSPRIIAFIAGNVGCSYNGDLETSQRSIELLEESLKLDPASVWTANRYMCLSGAYRSAKQYQRALENADSSIKVAVEKSDLDYQSQAYHERALVYEELRKYPEALADIQQSIGLLEQLRAGLVPQDYLKQGYVAKTQEYFEKAIELHEKLNQHKEAMVVAEEARARAFLDLLASRGLRESKKLDSDGAEGHVTAEAAGAAAQGSAAQDATKILVATRGGAPLKLEGTNVASSLSSQAFVAPPTFDELLSTAQRLDSTVVSYWVLPEATLIWVLQADGTVRSERVTVKSERLVKLIRAASYSEQEQSAGVSPPDGVSAGKAPPRSATRGSQTLRLRGGGELTLSSARKPAWRELYGLLVAPVRDSLPQAGGHLTIVPQGPLFRLSFAALQDSEGHYLIERYALSYAPSLGVLRFTSEREKQLGRRPPSYLIVADPKVAPDLARDPGLPPLPGAREEARSLARLLPRGETSVLVGLDASKKAVEEDVAGRTVLHLATHAIVRDDSPLDSYLVVSSGDESLPGAGRLSVEEIYRMRLDTDLVVLSACRTALGKLSGDGMAGLTRAFFYAGSPSVLATLWDVADEPTSSLISDFYKSMQTEPDKRSALRAAQLRLIRRLRAGQVRLKTPLGPVTLREDPVFWAGFVLQGEP